MALKIAGYLFTGPQSINDTVIRPNQDPAIWAVIVKAGPAWDPEFQLVDIGGTGESGCEFGHLPNASRWIEAGASLYLLPLPKTEYTPVDRQNIEQAIVERYLLPHARITG